MKAFLFLTGSLMITSAAFANTFAFTANIRPIFVTRCALCHSKGGSLPVWTDYATAFKYRDEIRNRVFILKNMPMSNATNMTDDERAAVAQWVEEGAPE